MEYSNEASRSATSTGAPSRGIWPEGEAREARIDAIKPPGFAWHPHFMTQAGRHCQRQQGRSDEEALPWTGALSDGEDSLRGTAAGG